jgi:hypothetical protein
VGGCSSYIFSIWLQKLVQKMWGGGFKHWFCKAADLW